MEAATDALTELYTSDSREEGSVVVGGQHLLEAGDNAGVVAGSKAAGAARNLLDLRSRQSPLGGAVEFLQ